MKLDTLQAVLLAAAGKRTLKSTLVTLVEGLAGEPDTALARIWLLGPGDICADCLMRPECPDQTRCLHLLASDGRSARTGERWSRLDGNFQRFPLGVRKIGKIGASGKPILILNVPEQTKWIQPDWAKAEGIQSFAGHSLMFNNEPLGVLAIFSRGTISDEDVRWLQIFADHAAAAIANARAYDEIDSLREKLEHENEYLRNEVHQALHFGDIIGASPRLKKTLQQVGLVAPTDASVLIHGESGTGKELIARSIHEKSRRSDRPMIKVNCATIPKELFESEFFGHVKGSFTGAVKDRVGRFELADRGTLFLDEVGEIPLDLQSKLLRVLQEGEFERVGETVSRKVNVRVISATNRDLGQEIEAGRFRQDLYYRLNVFPIEVPPLRERPEDIEPLARHFVMTTSKKHGLPPVKLTRAQLKALGRYEWPGNVRELQHVIERALIMSSGGKDDFVSAMIPGGDSGRGTETSSTGVPKNKDTVISFGELKRLEQGSIEAALKQANGKIYGSGGAAELLGVKPTTLASRMKTLGISKP